MKKLLFACFVLSISVYPLRAQPPQPCTDEIIMAVKGKWTTKPNADMKAVNSQAIIRIDKMQKMLEAAYSDPKGMEARRYQPSTNKPLIENGPVSYRLISGFFSYYCNKNVNKLLMGGETGTWANTFVNGFGWFISDQYDLLSIKVNGDNVYVLPSVKGKWKGYPIYEATADRDKGRCIILTHNNQVPWKPITQQQ